MFRKRPRIDHLAPNVLRGEWLELVSGDDEVGERVEGHGAVVVPVHGTRVQRERGQVGLTRDRLGEVSADVASLGEVNRVSAHFCHNIFSEYHDLLGAELYSGGICQKLAPGNRFLIIKAKL